MEKISIVTINYNNAQGLINTIKSVILQNIVTCEYIVIDGDSIDGSKEVIQEYNKEIDFWVSEKDTGIYHAMNKGIERATGEYIMFLNSGDYLCSPDVLQRCHALMEQNPGADVYYGDMYLINDPKHPYRHHCRHPEQLSLEYLKKDTINHQASLIRSSLFREFGLYPEQFRLASDYWLFLNCFLHNKVFCHVPIPLVDYDFSGASSTNQRLYQEEKRRIWESLVPGYVQSLLKETENCRQLKEYRIVKAAIWLNNNFQALKKN